MDSNDKNEMEEIQRGLEAFLEKEMDGTIQEKRRSGTGGRADAAGEREEIHIIGQPEDRGEFGRSRETGGEDAYDEGWLTADEGLRERGRQPVDGEPYRRVRRSSDGELHRRGRSSDEEPYLEDWQPEDEEESFRERRQEDWDSPVRRRAADYSQEPRQRRRYREEEPAEFEEEPIRRRRTGYKDEPARRRAEYEDEPVRRRRLEYDEEPSYGKKRFRDAEQSQWEEESRMSKKTQKAQKKRRKRKSRLKRFLIAAALIVVLLGAGLYQLVGVVYGKMTYKEIASVASAPLKEDGVVNILLIGNDSRENGEDGRSDAMILVSISNRTKTIYMTSLLRDMYVDIPGHDGNRLNAAYSFGGAELLMETIEQNFDIPVNRYMLVNFEAFANLVDAVDGIDLELSKGEIEYVNGYLWEYNMLTGRADGTDNMDPSVADNGPALVHLNGPQALAYSRNRYIGTDFGRTERQRKILEAVIHKLPSAVLTNAGGLVDGLMPNLTTNLTRNECFRLSLMAGKVLTYDIVSDSIPQPDTYKNATIRSMAVLEVDFDANIRYLKEKIYGE